MKRMKSYIAIFILAVIGQTALAADYKVGQNIYVKSTEGVEISFEIISLSPKTCRLNSWCISSSTTGKITVPYSAEGFTVVEAKDYAFYNCSSITSIILPSDMKKMGNSTFYSCSSLTNVSFPSGLKEIGEWSFCNCKSLKSITIPSNVTIINRYMFYQCESLTSVNLPSSLTEIGYGAFEYCKSLKSISCPSKFTKIGDYAFYYCEALESFSGGNSLKEIGMWAFYGCEALESFSGSNSLKEIGSFAFYNCKALKTITGIANVEFLGSFVFYNTPWLYSLPSGMIYIGKVAFMFKDPNTMAKDTKLDIKEGTTSIAESAFSSCSNLISVSIPKTVRSIGNDAFYNCSNLNSMTVASGNDFYDSRDNCNAIIQTATNTLISGCNTTVIPRTVKALGYDAFAGCQFTSITIPDNVDSVANDAFWNCVKLKSVTIGKGVRKIGTNVFSYCYNLEDIIVSSANPNFDSRNNCKGIVEKSSNTLIVGTIKTVIPSNVKAIGPYAFRTCNNGDLYTYTIPNHIEKIGSSAFEYNSSMRSVTIGSGVKSIENSAFFGCTKLLVIHSLIDTPFEINENVFQLSSTNGLDSLYNHAVLYVPHGSQVNYMTTPGWNKFKHIVETDGKSLMDGEVFTAETVEGQLLTYQVNSVNKKNCTLIGSPIDITGKVTIPTSANGFTVKAIDERAFYNSNRDRNITAIIIPEGITSIGEHAFYNCESLSLPSLPNSLESIGEGAFCYCKGSSITIPASIKSIGIGAFGGCNELTSITVNASNNIYASPEGCNAIIEKATKRLITGCKTTTIPNTVECIAKSAFNSIKDLTSITIPGSVSIIDSLAFNNTGLASIEIPSSVRSIAYRAFHYCDNLKSISSKIQMPFGIPDDVFECRAEVESPYESATLYVPIGTKSTYQATDGWKKFVNIVEKEDVIETNCAGIIAGTEGTIYRVTGICTQIDNTTYGNWYLTDNSGQVYIYGTLDQNGNTKNFLSWGLEVGDIVTVEGPRQNYNGTIELVNVTVVKIVKSKESYEVDGVEYELSLSDNTAKIVCLTKENADIIIPSHITNNGNKYNVTTIGETIFPNKDNNIYSITFPATITTVAANAFDGYVTSAIVWNSDTPLPENAFKGNEYQNTNFLLYVNKTGIAPSGVANVIVNSMADEITLVDGAEFNCPQEFTARKISYTHNYRMQTGLNESAGWETIALPFDVATIQHETKGVLTPFALWQGGSDRKPFWLYSLGNNGFVKASSIKANTPYLISMPNNSKYSANYNISGRVTFSATNTKVYHTGYEYLNKPSYNGATFIPAYHSSVGSNLYYLNVTNDFTTYSGREKPGSIFLINLRKATPFESYIYKNSNARSFEIVFDENDQTTAIQGILTNNDHQMNQMTVYSLSGQYIGTFNKNELQESNKKLPSGIYLVNGKKMIIQ